MTRREDAREMAAVLDKAREISRNEPSADWSEAEWKELIATAVSQKPEGKIEGARSRLERAFWRPALAYGTLALVLVAFIGLALKNTVFKPTVSPATQALVLAQKPVPSPLPALKVPPAEMPAVIAQAPRILAPKPARTVIHPRKPALPAARPRKPAAPREEVSQDVVSVKLVSPETDLQIVWFLDKNFEWKGENP
jgi:hypothetical protein